MVLRTDPQEDSSLNASGALAGAAPGKGTLVLEARLGEMTLPAGCVGACLQPDQNPT